MITQTPPHEPTDELGSTDMEQTLASLPPDVHDRIRTAAARAARNLGVEDRLKEKLDARLDDANSN